MIKNITVFGSASKQMNKKYCKDSYRFGQIIGENNMRLIFGIGDNGLMGEVFRGALSRGAKIRGITTRKLLKLQCENPKLFKKDEKKIVPNLAKRKQMMFREGDVMVILPGGWGTVDEFSDYAVSLQVKGLTWNPFKKKTFKKPVVFLNTLGFWDGLKDLLATMKKAGALNEDKLDFVEFVEKPEDIIPVATELWHKLKGTK